MEPTIQSNQSAPVYQPTQKAKVTAKDFFLNLGAFVVLYTLVATFLTFLFSIINSVFPDTRDIYNYYDPYGSSMRLSVSILIVATPLLIYLLRAVHKIIAAEPAKKDIWIRRWGLYLTLFLAVIMLAVDLVTFINVFLGGETAARFIWKVIVTLIVGIILVWYTRADLKNKFSDYRNHALILSWAFITVIVAAIIVGFSMIGSPNLIRNIRDDNQRESDLMSLNGQILSYYQSKNAVLPANLDEIISGDPYANQLPTDPATKQPYRYEVVRQGPVYVAGKIVASSTWPAYKLCAGFAEDGDADKRIQSAGDRGGMIVAPSGMDMGSSYYPGYESRFDKHPEGEHCFDQTIDPVRFPPYDRGKVMY